MYSFHIIVVEAKGNYSACSPDLSGCVATGETREEAEGNMYQAIDMHLHGLVGDNEPVPDPHANVEIRGYSKTSCYHQER